jgi:hypothetical protein
MTLANSLSDPLDRNEHTLQAGVRPHEFRANGSFDLPIGPTKLLFRNSHGWLARALERWQTSWILNLSSGSWSTISATSRTYSGTGAPDVVVPVDFNALKDYEWGNRPTGLQLNANYFGQGKFVNVPDPQCDIVTTKQNLKQAFGSVTQRCTIRALAMIVPEGTPGAFTMSDGSTARIVLQNALPGKRGTFGANTVKGFGTIRFDASLSKSFKVTETKSLQVRFDATNVLNHPSPGAPTLDINGNNTFGNISTKTGTRTLQARLRLQF